MATSSSGKLPFRNQPPPNPIPYNVSANSLVAYRDRDVLKHSRRQAHRGSSIDLRLKIKASKLNEKNGDAPVFAFSGIAIDEIRRGIKILIPSRATLPPDPLVQKIQARLKELGVHNADGTDLSVNGHFSAELGQAIAKYRTTLEERVGVGEHVDAQLIEHLFHKAQKVM